jgi:DcuC family C4-dicarboxylate transporter
LSPITTGAALLLGCSIGGELFNPAAPEVLTTFQVSQKAAKDHPELSVDPLQFDASRCVQRIFPLNLVGLLVGTLVFWVISLLWEARTPPTPETEAAAAPMLAMPSFLSLAGILFLLRAIVPLFPLVFLYLCSYPLNLVEIDSAWLVSPTLPADRIKEVMPTRLIGLAMVLGVAAAVLATPSQFKGAASAFFEGAAFGFGHIVSLIVVAQGFAKGIELVGFAQTIAGLIEAFPDLLIPLAGFMALGFAFLCGSGMATAQGLFGFFAGPALLLGIDPTHVGAVVSLAAAAGRTMSPVSAVTLMCARMTETKPLDLVKQVAIPLVISVAIIVVVAMIIAPAV